MCRALEKVKRPGTFLLGGTYHAKTTSSRLAVRPHGGRQARCPGRTVELSIQRSGTPRVDAVMLTRLSRFSYHRLALYLILCFLQDHGVGLITTEYELRYILYLRGFERTLLDRAQENGCNALWAEGE